jgi:hypothetical protein
MRASAVARTRLSRRRGIPESEAIRRAPWIRVNATSPSGSPDGLNP